MKSKLDTASFAVRRFVRARAQLQRATDERWESLERLNQMVPDSVGYSGAAKSERIAEEAQQRAAHEYEDASVRLAEVACALLGVDPDGGDSDLAAALAASVELAGKAS